MLPNSFKSALIPWLARIPRRVGYLGESRYVVVDHRVAGPDPARSMSERYAALAAAVGAASDSPLPRPHLVVPPDAIDAARRRFGFVPDETLVALCPGAEYGPAKRWPADHFADLAKRLVDRPGTRVMLLGGPGDRAICAAIADAADAGDRVRDLAGETTLDEAIALIAAASHVVANDSGLMHVAAALDRPQVALFGSSDPRHTPPLSPRSHVLWLHLDCSPCFERTCPLGHLDCLVGIAPQQVIDSMQNDPPPVEAELHPRWSS